MEGKRADKGEPGLDVLLTRSRGTRVFRSLSQPCLRAAWRHGEVKVDHSLGVPTPYGLSPEGQHRLTILSTRRPPVRYYRRAGRSPGARDRFPRVLFLAGRFPEARKAFASGASAVPEWAFLRWVSQMLGVTGREEGLVVIQVGLFLVFHAAAWSRRDLHRFVLVCIPYIMWHAQRLSCSCGAQAGLLLGYLLWWPGWIACWCSTARRMNTIQLWNLRILGWGSPTPDRVLDRRSRNRLASPTEPYALYLSPTLHRMEDHT